MGKNVERAEKIRIRVDRPDGSVRSILQRFRPQNATGELEGTTTAIAQITMKGRTDGGRRGQGHLWTDVFKTFKKLRSENRSRR